MPENLQENDLNKPDYKLIDAHVRMFKKLRKKISELEKLLQEAKQYGITGKINITSNGSVIKTTERIDYQ